MDVLVLYEYLIQPGNAAGPDQALRGQTTESYTIVRDSKTSSGKQQVNAYRGDEMQSYERKLSIPPLRE